MNGAPPLNGKFARLFIQMGGIGIAVLVLFGSYFLFSNHISHNTEVLFEVKEAVNANTTQSKEVERVLEKLVDKL